MIDAETYTVRISTQNPILSEPEFIAWLKKSGHIVTLTANERSCSINGIVDTNEWTKEAFCELLDAFEYTEIEMAP